MKRAGFVPALVAVCLVVWNCFDAVTPRFQARLSLVPVFSSANPQDGTGNDVDSFVVSINNPPAPPVSASVKILPGQDTISLTLTVQLNSAFDTVGVTFKGFNSVTGLLLYQGTQQIGVSAGTTATPTPVSVTYVGPGQGLDSVAVNPPSATVAPGTTLQLTYTGYDAGVALNDDSVPVRYRSSDEKIARVNAAGLVTAVANGLVDIVVTSVAKSSIKDTAFITVATIIPPSIVVNPNSRSFADTVNTANPTPQTVSVSNGGGGTLTGLAVGTISYGPGATGWLTATLDQSTAPATLTLAPANTGLAAGTYTATVPIAAAVASNSPQTVTVTLALSSGAPPPAIALTPTSVTVPDTVGTTSPAAQTVAVSNAGGGSLTGLAVGTITYGPGANGWLSASLNTTTAPATLTLQASNSGLAAGTYTATVPVTSAVASNSPQSVTFTYQVAPVPPAIALAPAAVTVADTAGTTNPAAQTVAVTNSGGAPLTGLAVGTISYGPGATGWLVASLNTSTAPATLTLQASNAGLSAGSYTATIPVTSPVASNSPQSVTFTYNVSQPLPASLQITPGFSVYRPGDVQTASVVAKDAGGNTISAAGTVYTSRNSAVATINATTGAIAAVAGGTTTLVATLGTVADSLDVIVAANGVAVFHAAPDGRSYDVVHPGDTVRMLVAINLRGVAPEKLGSYNAQLNWTPAVLQYVRTDIVAGGFATPTLNATSAASGQLRFSAADANGNAGPSVGLVTVVYVATGIGTSPITHLITDISASGTFTNLLPTAVLYTGTVKVQ